MNKKMNRSNNSNADIFGISIPTIEVSKTKLDSHRTVAIALSELEQQLDYLAKTMTRSNKIMKHLVTKNGKAISPDYADLLMDYSDFAEYLNTYRLSVHHDCLNANFFLLLEGKA
ncbi:hypothetical protein ACFP3T_13565 [Lactiplantibacillus dongliensis]|uniref:Uncharacterized protein n=1 Tax=Lactiplantibacillus dongliensis TaxID=2559919 RepID=A0ABW1RA63_9LACO|nr:hypothetical protein [Lactiplantibacillus dongliensis]